MPSTGRPERPLDPPDGPLTELARGLRQLRSQAGLTYRQLAERTGLAMSTLTTAASGGQLPSWRVTRAYVLACHGDEEQWRALWERACTAVGRPVPADLDPVEGPPDPAAAATPGQFLEQMKHLRTWAGSPSLATLNRRSGGFLPPSTVSEALSRGRLPRHELLTKYVRACGLEDDKAHEWERAWAKLKAREAISPAPPTSAIDSFQERTDHVLRRTRWLITGVVVSVLVSMLTISLQVFGSPSRVEGYGSSVKIGVFADLPGLSTYDPETGTWSGFDIELAKAIARQLGSTPVFVPVSVRQREEALRRRDVDMVIASYSITEERLKRMTFAGPYMFTMQGIMVRSDVDNPITSVEDLVEKTTCTVRGSTSLLRFAPTAPRTEVMEQPSLSGCIADLLEGEVEAVLADELTLRSYALRANPNRLGIVPGLRFTFGSADRYGVGLLLRADCKKITLAINEFIISGAWDKAFRRNFPGLTPSVHKPDKLNSCR